MSTVDRSIASRSTLTQSKVNIDKERMKKNFPRRQCESVFATLSERGKKGTTVAMQRDRVACFDLILSGKFSSLAQQSFLMVKPKKSTMASFGFRRYIASSE